MQCSEHIAYVWNVLQHMNAGDRIAGSRGDIAQRRFDAVTFGERSTSRDGADFDADASVAPCS